MNSEYKITADRGQIIGRRKRQEDSVDGGLAANDSVFFVLADGMGGYDGGDKASQAAISAFAQAMTQEDDLLKALYSANEYVAHLKRENKLAESAGCTLIGVKIQGKTCSAVSVGDSYLLYQSSGNKVRQLNKLHNQGAELDAMAASGAITPQQAAEAPHRNALTSALTGAPFRLINRIEPIEIETGDRLIMLSDGFLTLGWDALEQVLRHNPITDTEAPSKIVAQVLEQIEKLKHPQQDNTSIIVAQLNETKTSSDTAEFCGFYPLGKTSYTENKPLIILACLLTAVVVAMIATMVMLYLSHTRSQPADDNLAPPKIQGTLNLSSTQAQTSPDPLTAQSMNAWSRLNEKMSRFNENIVKSLVNNTSEWDLLKYSEGAACLNFEEIQKIYNNLNGYKNATVNDQEKDAIERIQCYIFEGMLYRSGKKFRDCQDFRNFVTKDDKLAHFFEYRLKRLTKKSKNNSDIERTVQYLNSCAKLEANTLRQHVPQLATKFNDHKKNISNDAEAMQKIIDGMLLSAAAFQSQKDSVKAVAWCKKSPELWGDLLQLMKETTKPKEQKKEVILFENVKEEECASFVLNLMHIYKHLKKKHEECYSEIKPLLGEKTFELIKNNALIIMDRMKDDDDLKNYFVGFLIKDMAPQNGNLTLNEFKEALNRHKQAPKGILTALAAIAEIKGITAILPELEPPSNQKQLGEQLKMRHEFSLTLREIKDENKKDEELSDVCDVFALAMWSKCNEQKNYEETEYFISEMRKELTEDQASQLRLIFESDEKHLDTIGKKPYLKKLSAEVRTIIKARHDRIKVKQPKPTPKATPANKNKQSKNTDNQQNQKASSKDNANKPK